MRHRNLGRQFSRDTSHRRAMFRALVANLVLHERIETTEAKAKELRRVAEKLITKAVRLGDVAFRGKEQNDAAASARRSAAKREMAKFLGPKGVVVDDQGRSIEVDLVEKVFVELGRRYQGRPGGYTRIIKLGPRRGDNAPMTLIELVGSEAEPAAAVAGS